MVFTIFQVDLANIEKTAYQKVIENSVNNAPWIPYYILGTYHNEEPIQDSCSVIIYEEDVCIETYLLTIPAGSYGQYYFENGGAGFTLAVNETKGYEVRTDT